MGRCREMVCPGCGYSELVSGGGDAGMDCATQTVSCNECRRLFDVVALEFNWDQPDGEKEVQLRCPKRRKHTVIPWTYPGPCPRCGTTVALKADGAVILWD